MAQKPRSRRRSTGSRRKNSDSKIRPILVLDGLAVVGIAAAIVVWLAIVPGCCSWAWESLGYGWAPVGLWLSALAFGVRYHARNLLPRWRLWVASAALTAIAIGALSFFHHGYGPPTETGLAGRWGAALIGASPVLGIIKLLAIAIITPAVLFPRRVGLSYARGLERIGQSLGGLADRLRLGRYSNALIPQFARRFFTGASRGEFGSAPVAPSGSFNGSVVASADPESAPVLPSVQAFMVAELASYSTKPEDSNPEDSSLSELTRLLPPLELLSTSEVVEAGGADLQGMAGLIEQTLASHGVRVNVEEIQAGPRLVRFGLSPGWVGKSNEPLEKAPEERSEELAGENRSPKSRVRVQSILAREADLALALKTSDVRIQATIQGESLVGVEVPSPTPRKVGLRQLIETGGFGETAAKGGLPIAVGEDITGNGEVLDLTELPHLLIAGATGTGKSVCLNSIVASLLFAKSPDELRLLMIDPKGVELTQFDGVPHMLAPAIHELDGFAPALISLLEVMQQRYTRMRQVGVRNISAYNSAVTQPMPYLVLVVDELAELMLAGGKDSEASLVRLAQMGRATGIHLVLATQRPTVDVVTGLLKANIATRIGFTVASQTDSRVVLDVPGAENLLGKGDMLLLEKESPQPRRVQGCFVDDEEISGLVEFWINQPSRSSEA